MFLDKEKYTTEWRRKKTHMPVEVELYEPLCVTCKNRWNISVCHNFHKGRYYEDIDKKKGIRPYRTRTLEKCDGYSHKVWTEYECEFAKSERTTEYMSNEIEIKRSLMDELFDDTDEIEGLNGTQNYDDED